MLLLISLVLFPVALSVIWLPVLLRRRQIYQRYSGSRLVACPENRQPAAVSVNTRHAMATAIDGDPHLRLCDCTRWPERARCNQACLPQALQAESPSERTIATKPIYHLPVLLAAFLAWCLGTIWHSQWLFRARWMNALSLTHAEVKQIVWWLSPHLLTAAVCLLFAYGVAWLLAVSHRKGMLQGMLVSLLLCATLTAASWSAAAGLPQDLLAIEASYAVLATLLMGAIVGGLYNKLVLPPN
jgi:hypothetical protein